MQPSLFEDSRRRRINLGGASGASSQSALLDQAKARRLERQTLKRKQDSAIKIQSWWRGMREARSVRRNLRRALDQDVASLTGLRCLVLIGQEEGRSAHDTVYAPARAGFAASWLVLIRKASLMLCRSLARDPQSPNAIHHVHILSTLLSPAAGSRALGTEDSQAALQVSKYLVDHDYQQYLARAITQVPIERKSQCSALPGVVRLLVAPFSIWPADTPTFATSLLSLLTRVLTLPILPNRLPLESLAYLSSSIPYPSLHVLDPHTSALVNVDVDSKVHLLANLVTFTAPRYPALATAALSTYLRLLTALLNTLPVNALDPPSPAKSNATPNNNATPWRHQDSDDSDSEEAVTQVTVVSTFAPPPRLPDIDSRTLKRLQTLQDDKQLASLLAATKAHPAARPGLIAYLLALTTAWPATRERVLSTVLAHTGGTLVRELYRGYVRGSPLGREGSPGAVLDPTHAPAWPPLLLIADLYTQALLTMGDDEFFGEGRNPLTLDEVASFGRQLLTIAYTLFTREDQSGMVRADETVLRCSWENAREKITRCLTAIHARDSRKSFVPRDHWLVTSQLDMQAFVEAAIYEEQQLAQSDIDLPPRALSKRQIAAMSPRLGVLNNIPFAIPFEVRVSIFRHFVANDMLARGRSVNRYAYGPGQRTRAEIRRGRVAEDGFDRLGDADLKAPLEIAFIDQFGEPEAGIDGGGLFKEFFTSLCKEVFDTDRGLWLANKKNELYPNPHAYATEGEYGEVLLCIGIRIMTHSFLDDLVSLDPELYNGLIFLKNYDGDFEALSLNFTVAVEEFGEAKSMDLVPNGSNIPVTKENRLQYIHLVSHYRLTRQIKLQSEAFFEGLSQMVDPKWLRMFNQQEVQVLIGGANAPVDIADLRAHTNYGGLYDDNESTIQIFWKVVNAFDQDQRQGLLRFVTSCSRPPLLGFKELVPNFAIRDAGSDENRLPTASTCVNLLKLPRYRSERILRDKLLQAINSNAGFDLS
ncbi:HECT-domain-containing protein [Schizophyllum amplum]|uniref:HECT-type E3 ubiquitin transferase n=1 Tax=Schizophyllum amplum TaxID=97359 RepID=A0A550C816_9AGAR|nr:HECT-domain-containing protein [Auriculariopsis ampla]